MVNAGRFHITSVCHNSRVCHKNVISAFFVYLTYFLFSDSKFDSLRPVCVTGLYSLRMHRELQQNMFSGYREADLRLCFCICKKPVFS